MAQDKSEANPEIVKGTTRSTTGQVQETKSNQEGYDKMLKENEGLKQAQSTLTKSNDELRADLSKIKEALGSVVGVPQGEKPTTEGLLQTALEKINGLEKQASKSRARDMLDTIVSGFKDGDKELDGKIKDYLRSEVQADEPNEELILDMVKQKFQSVKSLLGTTSPGMKTPDIKATAGSFSRNPTANDILGL